MKRTPFYNYHKQLGARLVEFGGYEMPISYGSIIEEHLAVRQRAGLFDVSHMGEFVIHGSQAAEFVQYATINDINKLKPGQVQYSAMCLENGGIVDDLLVYRFDNHFMLVVNAANIEKDYAHLRRIAESFEVHVENRSVETALLALQGPKSKQILQSLVGAVLDGLPYYHFAEAEINGNPVIISRTGYTGELGYEIYHDPDCAPWLWESLMEAGQTRGMVPAGLGARDTLRLEMKYCLYGNDIDETTTPLEARLGWITSLEKGPFVGREALERQKAERPKRYLVAFEMLSGGIPRHGYDIFKDGERVGQVTSGGQSPVLRRGIGMAYVAVPHHKIGTKLEINIRGKHYQAEIIKPPFIKETSLHAD